MASIEDIIDEVKATVGPLADSMVRKYAEQAKEDVDQFLTSSKASLALWKEQLENEEITVREFELFVGGLGDIAALKILKNAALAQERILQFIGSVLTTIIDIILKEVLK